MNIPLVDLHAQYLPLKREIFAGMEDIFESMQLFLGKNVQSLETEFAQVCGTQFGIGVSDGTNALQIILRAMDIGPGDEVITVSHTFIATAEAILLAGASPVFVDITSDTLLMDASQVESKISPRTKAILPVHLYGQVVDMDPLREIAKRYGLKLIEDACQAHGATYKGKPAGSLGDAAAFSFYYSKNLGALGEGGFIATNDPDVYRKARMIRDHGSERRYYHDLLGMNGRLDEIQAVILRAKLPHLAEYNRLRRDHARLYNELLANMPITVPIEFPGNQHIYHMYVIRTPKRNDLQIWLKENGIGSGIHYPIPIHLQNSIQHLGGKKGDLPTTESVVEEILSLPMYPELPDESIEFVVDTISKFFTQ